MKIHTDTLTRADLWGALPAGIYLEVTEHGSRSRARRYDVGLCAEPGEDAHGIHRCYARNTGQHGAATWWRGETDKAATWIEWGDWICALFKLDPDAIIGEYDGAEDFARKTAAMAPYRPKRESAPEHARRWAAELGEWPLRCDDCGTRTMAVHDDGSMTCGHCYMERARALGVIR